MPARKKPARPNSPPKKGRHVWRKAFLSALAATGNVGAASRAANIDRHTALNARKSDPAFAAEYRAALSEACDALELEARRRAVQGLLRLQFYKGEPLIDPRTQKPYYEVEYSDTLLIFLLKAHRPKKYRDRHEVTGKDGKDLIPTDLSAIRRGLCGVLGIPLSEPAA